MLKRAVLLKASLFRNLHPCFEWLLWCCWFIIVLLYLLKQVMGRIWAALDIALPTLASRLPHMVPLPHSLHQRRSPQRLLLVVGKTTTSRASILIGADHSLLTSSMQYKPSGNRCSDHKCHWIVSLMNITNVTGGCLCVCVVECV